MKKYITSIVFFLGLFALSIVNASPVKKNSFSIKSPNKKVRVKLKNTNGFLRYELFWEGKKMINSSQLSVLPGVETKITKSVTNTHNQTWKTVWGQFDKIKDKHNELVLSLDLEGVKGELYVRVFNQGIAFRYKLKEYKEGTKAVLYCEYDLFSENNLYFPSGEKEPLGPLSVSSLLTSNVEKFQLPIVVERSDHKHLSILESDLFSASNFDLMNVIFDKNKGKLASSNTVSLLGENMVSPWRVILLEKEVGDFLVNTVPLNLAAPSLIKDPSWIKPGKTLWDWRVHGYTAPDGFKYGIDTESYLRFIDFAAEKKIEYFLIDDAWYTHITKGHIEMSKKLDLKKVSEYAKKKGVDLILYYDRRHGDYGDKELFPHYKSLGMKGIKYGFMNANVPFTKNAILESSKSQLLIDFHDGPVPMTGVSRTLPNAITREYCHAQQDSRRVFTPEGFIKMALINAITGPLDMNNGNFDINGINNGNRQKGPKKKNSYLTTVTAETARTLIINSGLVCIPDAPEAYAAKSDLFEFIQEMPVGKWSESKILHSKMSTYISTARRHKDSWFIGSVIDQKGGTLPIRLDFLKEGIIYDVTYYEDTDKTHCKTNPEAYRVRKGILKKDDLIKIKMAPGGGNCMWIRPQNND